MLVVDCGVRMAVRGDNCEDIFVSSNVKSNNGENNKILPCSKHQRRKTGEGSVGGCMILTLTIIRDIDRNIVILTIQLITEERDKERRKMMVDDDDEMTIRILHLLRVGERPHRHRQFLNSSQSTKKILILLWRLICGKAGCRDRMMTYKSKPSTCYFGSEKCFSIFIILYKAKEAILLLSVSTCSLTSLLTLTTLVAKRTVFSLYTTSVS